jgi:hypothetical protein
VDASINRGFLARRGVTIANMQAARQEIRDELQEAVHPAIEEHIGE